MFKNRLIEKVVQPSMRNGGREQLGVSCLPSDEIRVREEDPGELRVVN